MLCEQVDPDRFSGAVLLNGRVLTAGPFPGFEQARAGARTTLLDRFAEILAGSGG